MPKKTGFSALPTAISLWKAPESAIFPLIFQVKALPTPEITGFARILARAKPAPERITAHG
jgi:hypothetical protein